MAKSNRLPRRVRLGAVSIRFPEAHFSWAPQGMMSMFLAFGSSSSSLLQTYLDVVVVRPFSICLFYTFLGIFLYRNWDKLFVLLFLQKIVCLSSSCFLTLWREGRQECALSSCVLSFSI
ncbi:hypothetical protein COCVIDRAFT_97024 [Bipolaris victoriae FI3]|uniref:Uncharacterized protein n=1 Tax=Bipolaris victoriae (strain FI3) TaxID=930091 RepID=W7EV53_BIPV3|nr:hypothetical protein COCVIDRAFT_97024 [Bipolaris victoriae FI3]